MSVEIPSTAALVDFTIKRGTTWTLDFQWWQDQAKTMKVDTTGLVATLVARQRRNSTSPVLFDLLSGSDGNTLSDDGAFHFELLAATTEQLPSGGAYDLNVGPDGGGDPVTCLLTGLVALEKDVPPETGS